MILSINRFLFIIQKRQGQEIFDKIFSKLKNRLWIPYHVQFELSSKTERVIIEKPIIEKYSTFKRREVKGLNICKNQKILQISEQIKKKNTL